MKELFAIGYTSQLGTKKMMSSLKVFGLIMEAGITCSMKEVYHA